MQPIKYELMIIIDPARSEEQHEETLQKLQEVIARYGGTHDRNEIIGKKRLAFPIAKRKDGYYALVFFDADPDSTLITEIERHCRYSDEIIRSMVTRAVIGKSKGNPALLPEESRSRFSGNRGGGGRYGGPPRGGRDRDGGPSGPPRDRDSSSSRPAADSSNEDEKKSEEAPSASAPAAEAPKSE